MTEGALSSLAELEAQVTASTLAKHKKETELAKKLLEHYLIGFGKLGKFVRNKDNDMEYAWLLLITRGFNSLCCSFDLLLKGYYSQAILLIRSVSEDWLTAKDCENNPDTLHALLQGDEKFWKNEGRYSEMAKRVSKEFPDAWKEIYGTLSTMAHARGNALKILIDPVKKDLRLGSYYDDGLFLATYQTFLYVASIMPELLHKLLNERAGQWWIEIMPTLQVALAEIERVHKELFPPINQEKTCQ